MSKRLTTVLTAIATSGLIAAAKTTAKRAIRD
jgi:hypothetical protein